MVIASSLPIDENDLGTMIQKVSMTYKRLIPDLKLATTN